jgi:hypothetical protein
MASGLSGAVGEDQDVFRHFRSLLFLRESVADEGQC